MFTGQYTKKSFTGVLTATAAVALLAWAGLGLTGDVLANPPDENGQHNHGGGDGGGGGEPPPDTGRIAFWRWENIGGTGLHDLVLLDLDDPAGPTEQVIDSFEGFPRSSSWSHHDDADGRRWILFSLQGNCDFSSVPPDAEDGIWAIKEDGTSLHPVLLRTELEEQPDGTTPCIWMAALSPDDEWLAYSLAPASLERDLFIQAFDAEAGEFDADSSPIQLLDDPDCPDNPQADSAPTWSPDSMSIAFSDQSVDDVYRLDLGSPCAVNLTAPLGEVVRSPNWSIATFDWPSGRIVFGLREVMHMNPDGTDVQILDRATLQDQSPNWSPDATRIVFTGRTGNGQNLRRRKWNLYAVSPDGSGLVQLTNNDQNLLVVRPVWRPADTP